MLVILSFLNACCFPIFQPIFMILVSKFIYSSIFFPDVLYKYIKLSYWFS